MSESQTPIHDGALRVVARAMGKDEWRAYWRGFRCRIRNADRIGRIFDDESTGGPKWQRAYSRELKNWIPAGGPPESFARAYRIWPRREHDYDHFPIMGIGAAPRTSMRINVSGEVRPFKNAPSVLQRRLLDLPPLRYRRRP